MKNSEKTIIEIRSKETFLSGSRKRWLIKKTETDSLWLHFCGYSEIWTNAHLVKENKRGFTFSVYFAGKYHEHFVSRGDCEIIYEL